MVEVTILWQSTLGAGVNIYWHVPSTIGLQDTVREDMGGGLTSAQGPRIVRFSPPVNGPKDHWLCVLSLAGARVVCWRPHPTGT